MWQQQETQGTVRRLESAQLFINSLSLNETFNLGQTIDYQGINIADAASGEAGDITIKRGSEVVIAAEVTERVVERSRVVSTFTTKIAPLGIQDYLFFVKEAAPEHTRKLTNISLKAMKSIFST